MKNVKCLFLATAATLLFLQAITAQQLAEGEIKYQGATKLEKCDEVLISFILNADTKSIKNFYYKFNGITYTTTTGRTITQRKTSVEGYMANTVFELNENIIDSSAFVHFNPSKWQITIIQGWGTDVITGEFNLIYKVPDGQVVDLGTAPIEFKKVEETKQD